MNQKKTEKKGLIPCVHQLSWATDFGLDVTPAMVVQVVREFGCGGIEFFLSGANPVPVELIKSTLRSVEGLAPPIGCAIIRAGLDGDPLSRTRAKRTQAVTAIKAYLEVVRKLGGSLLVGPLINIIGRPRPYFPSYQERGRAVDVFCQVSEIAAEMQSKIALEFLQESEFPWPTTGQQVSEFILRVENACGIKGVLKVLFDVYHANRMEENLYDALKKILLAELLGHIHVAGPKRTPPRITQHILWKRIFQIVKRWLGCFTFETFGRECNLPPAVTGYAERLPAREVVQTGMATVAELGLN